MFINRVAATLLLATLSTVVSAAKFQPVDCAPITFHGGVNLSGAEFAPTTLPGIEGTNYIFPNQAEETYYVSKGMNLFRLPFLWERIQPVLGGPLDAQTMAWLTSFATAYPRAFILLDVHNGGHYNGNMIGSASGPTNAQFANLWEQLAAAFRPYQNVAFGLMNEPNGMTPLAWLGSANAAIAAIRGVGATNLITVPGAAFTGAWSWDSSGNAAVMGDIIDPAKNFVYEVHQYFDAGSSGTSATAVSAQVGVQDLQVFTTWAQAHHVRAILGEFGAADNPTMLAAMTNSVKYMQANPSVWMGWTYWSGGPWWGSYMYSIEPTGLGGATQADAPQMTALQPYLN